MKPALRSVAPTCARAFALFLVLLASSTFARAQTVIVVWGDSVMSGWGANASTGTPWGPEPFGAAVPGAQRWDTASQGWVPVTPYQNFQGTGADPVYGFCAAWRRFFGEEVYVVGLGVPGSDCDPTLGSRSWHPNAAGGLFGVFRTELQTALATLPTPHIRAVLFSTGNTDPTLNLVADIDAVNDAILLEDPGSTPTLLGVRSWDVSSPNTSINRALIPVWATGPGRRIVVDATSLPARTGGLPDGVHLTHFGSIFLGYYAVVLERHTP